MARRSPSDRSPWFGLIRLAVLVAGFAVLGASPRMARAGDEVEHGLTEVQRRTGGAPEIVQPGDDDQPTIAGKRRRAVTTAAPVPAGTGEPTRLDGRQKADDASSLGARLRQLLRSWWLAVR